MRTVTQFAYAWAGRRVGPWRAERSAAERDAIREGRASRCRDTGIVFLTVPADIITREAEPPMEVAEQRQRPVLRIVA
ncbi:MAG: hypothetical protein IT553_03070 [Sphingomonadaceae bacterium]|nr:hypothetical protein [Sphingomonadaceae bacterium]